MAPVYCIAAGLAGNNRAEHWHGLTMRRSARFILVTGAMASNGKSRYSKYGGAWVSGFNGGKGAIKIKIILLGIDIYI